MGFLSTLACALLQILVVLPNLTVLILILMFLAAALPLLKPACCGPPWPASKPGESSHRVSQTLTPTAPRPDGVCLLSLAET